MKAGWCALLATSIVSLLFTTAFFAVTWWLKDPQYRTPSWLLEMLGFACWL